ncbi:arsenical pump membrane protein-domain-containing protein [Mucor mucedo]|uniref:arsenical pump membrane protein-domain-containing protein n=1 Tax=Mucor mucedo TaxID=29922 RepID=UPI0022209E14|nr:arsenical pump membrane protein-domain-containing protein [Mucor mucedo]KAI7879231.1 arsenical pump membrane protein-domain-containing protein [Mucor mucedo]
MVESTLTTYSYVGIVIFLLVVILVIRPVTIRIKHIKIYLNISTVPPLGVLILLICRAIDFQVVSKGFLGSFGVQPWAILILFYSLAYICISLDMTGVFQFCAFWVSRKAGNRGMLAFTLFFILTSVMSGLTSNDVVILTGTVFLSYFTKVSDIRPTAFLMSEFTTANIASMALYIGNPTNVVVSEAYKISFITYSAWMLLPTVVCILISYVVLRILFRGDYYLPRHIQPPDADPKSVLVDPHGAIFGVILLACCLVTLVGTSFASVPVWMITLPFACVMLVRDIQYDLGFHITRLFKKTRPNQDIPLEPSESQHASVMRSTSYATSVITKKEPQSKWLKPIYKAYKWFGVRFPTLKAVFVRMPWSILPFSLGMFMLIEALAELGWVGIFATAMAVFAKNYVTAVFGMVFVSILACQLLNNLPMTILFTQIIQHPNFTQHVHSDATMQGFLLGLIVGSNLGACLTLVGSLAGIMFDHILKVKGIYTLGYFQFLKWNLIILPTIAVGACAVLIGEIWFMYER